MCPVSPGGDLSDVSLSVMRSKLPAGDTLACASRTMYMHSFANGCRTDVVNNHDVTFLYRVAETGEGEIANFQRWYNNSLTRTATFTGAHSHRCTHRFDVVEHEDR